MMSASTRCTLILAVGAALLASCATATTGAPKWGGVHSTPENEAAVLGVAISTATDAANKRALYSDFLFVGPSLWSHLVRSEPSARRIGTPTSVVNPATNQQIAARVFQTEQVDDLLKSQAFVAWMTKMSAGSTRAATAAERELFYYTIPFEIASEPISVIQRESDVVVILMSGEKATWIDILSDYRRR